MCTTTETENETDSNETVSETDSSETENETDLYGGKSKATFYRHLKNGPPVKRIKPWTVLGVSKATYYRKRVKAVPEPSVSIPDDKEIVAVEKPILTDWNAELARIQEEKESKTRVLQAFRERPQPKAPIGKPNRI